MNNRKKTYRYRYYNRRNQNNRRHKDIKILLVYSLCVLGLLLAILVTSGKIDALKKMFVQKSQKKTETKVIPEKIEPIDHIRVVLLTDEKTEYRNQVIVLSQGIETVYTKSQLADSNEPVILQADEGGIAVSNGTMAQSDAVKTMSQPYPGTIEIWNCPNGLVVVNDVSLDEYLMRVLPSEMPENFGLEALKAQAVCARSYVYVQAKAQDYPLVHANINDSTAYQVYNKQVTNATAQQAVEETKNQVLMVNNQIAEALYYSTSCGFTQDGSLFDQEHDYITSRYVGKNMPLITFDEYLMVTDEEAYEKNDKYFRWQVTLCGEYKDYGRLTSIDVKQRNAGGAIEQLVLKFEHKTVKLDGQLKIREYIGKMMVETHFNNGEVTTGTPGMLYSSAFTWKQDEQGNIVLYGGGFGHGCGMSQNGAKDLAAEGMGYKDILSYFYEHASLETIE